MLLVWKIEEKQINFKMAALKIETFIENDFSFFLKGPVVLWKGFFIYFFLSFFGSCLWMKKPKKLWYTHESSPNTNEPTIPP